ncbi:hypothetical protein M0R04_15400 [Candidatus Dojkabacteria bacterium]|jgi:hypothetical protein|nr:hypothetical protein [Candidatus Dojkabacteria bacterium]
MEYQKNEDGTDKLDEQGNPIPVEIEDEKGKEADKVIANLVEEVKDLRLQNSLVKQLLDKKEEVPITPDPNKVLTEDEKIALAVEKILQSKESSNAQANKKAAFEKFIIDNKEFNPDNDPTGLKRDALQKKFNRFNTEGLTSVDEFLSIIGEAKTLLLGNDNLIDTTKDKNPYSNPPTPRGNPPAKPNEVLTPREIKLAETTGRTKEQILKLKLKHPEFIAELLQHVKD